jgi:hypothetical protein
VWGSGPLSCPYSPYVGEEEFSEVRIALVEYQGGEETEGNGGLTAPLGRAPPRQVATLTGGDELPMILRGGSVQKAYSPKCLEEEFCELLRLLGILGSSGWGCVAAPVTNNNKRPGPWSPKAPVPTRSGWLELSGAPLMPIASASTEQHVAARA